MDKIDDLDWIGSDQKRLDRWIRQTTLDSIGLDWIRKDQIVQMDKILRYAILDWNGFASNSLDRLDRVDRSDIFDRLDR